MNSMIISYNLASSLLDFGITKKKKSLIDVLINFEINLVVI
jgi:hypothetical protein